MAGIASDHFQKFLICSAYVKPYGLLPGGKIFNGFEAAAGDNNVDENNNNIDKIDIGGVGAFIVSNNRDLIRTLGDQWWNWALSIDTSKVGNPFNDATGALCDLGRQPGNLLFLVGTAGEITNGTGTSGQTGDVRTCDTPIPRGTNIFFPIFNTECSV